MSLDMSCGVLRTCRQERGPVKPDKSSNAQHLTCHTTLLVILATPLPSYPIWDLSIDPILRCTNLMAKHHL